MSGPSPASPEVEADLADRAHRDRVDERLREASARGTNTWAELLDTAEGADPRLVGQRLAALGLTAYGLAADRGPRSSRWVPELHARDFEWYFTSACAADLAGRVARAGPRVLCLGTPTVAVALLERGSPGPVTLVDRNPLIARRCPSTASIERVTGDLAAVRLPAGHYDTAIFDAPWYPAALERWLTRAARAVRVGGRVWFALLPRLHRPRAPDDRARILALAGRIGPVQIEPGALRYDSPRFELEALAASPLAVPPAWRRADLVEVSVQRTPADPPSSAGVDPGWARVVLGSQVVHLDQRAPDEPGPLLAPIDDRGDFRYASISTRDPRRACIGLWTSRSRVARVRRPAAVAELLERLAEADDPRALDDAPVLRGLPPPERRGVLEALRTLVGLRP